MTDTNQSPDLPPDFSMTGAYVNPQTGGVVIAGTQPGPLPWVAIWHASVLGDVVQTDRWDFAKPPQDLAAAMSDGFQRIYIGSQGSLRYVRGAASAAAVMLQLPPVTADVPVDTSFYVLDGGTVSYVAQHPSTALPAGLDATAFNDRALAVAAAEAFRRAGHA